MHRKTGENELEVIFVSVPTLDYALFLSLTSSLATAPKQLALHLGLMKGCNPLPLTTTTTATATAAATAATITSKITTTVTTSVVEPKLFVSAPAPAPAPTFKKFLLRSRLRLRH
jgi:hypothetical protein